MKETLNLFIILALLMGLFYILFWDKPARNITNSGDCREVMIADKTFILERAFDDITRNKGLSGREYIRDESGMIFEFENAGSYGFWMKDMLIPIDIIFVSTDTLTDIYQHVNPISFPEVFSPSQDINYVIELSAGQSEKLNLEIGNKIKIFPPKACNF